MPFKSEAQRKLFHAMADRGEIAPKKVEEWEHATKNKKDLPEHVDQEKKSAFYELGIQLAFKELGLV